MDAYGGVARPSNGSYKRLMDEWLKRNGTSHSSSTKSGIGGLIFWMPNNNTNPTSGNSRKKRDDDKESFDRSGGAH